MTEVTRRFDRDFLKRNIGMTARSGFNVKYDNLDNNQPIFNTKKNSLKKLVSLEHKSMTSKLNPQ